MHPILFATLITLLAGLSTGIGGAVAFFSKRTNTKLLSVSLGFSAGVMIYVSFVDLFPEAKQLLEPALGAMAEFWLVVTFFSGMLLVFLIDLLVPESENPHELHGVEEMHHKQPNTRPLKRVGLTMMIAIAIHNFPEGMATFMSAIVMPEIAIPIAIAIAIHNIPEGIAVSVPFYYATGNRKKAFGYSLLSGLAEPLGGVIGYMLLRNYLTHTILGLVLAGVAGIMVFISIDELLPSAQKYGKHHYSIAGCVAGMMFMALSLLLL